MRMVFMMIIFMLISAVAFAGEEGLTKDEFLDVLEALQSKVKSIKYHVNVEIFYPGKDEADRTKYILSGAKPDVLNYMDETPYYSTFQMALKGAPDGNARIKLESLLPWVIEEGKLHDKPTHGITEEAFNKEVLTFIDWQTDGKHRPMTQEIKEGRGFVTTSLGGATHINDGLSLITAYYMDRGLAQMLRESPRWKILHRKGDIYVVRHVATMYYRYGSSIVTRDINIDMARGGAITHIKEYRGDQLDKADPKVSGEGYEIVYKEYADGIWMPEKATWDFMRGGRFRFTFHDIIVNPEIPDDYFTLDFVPGYQVIDDISGTHYIAGTKDEGALVREAEDMLSGVDDILAETEDKPAARPEKITPSPEPAVESAPVEVPSPPASGSPAIILTVIAVIAVVIIVAVILMRRKSGGRN